MKKYLLAALLLALAAYGLAFGKCHLVEPTYHNKKLTAWLHDLETRDRPTVEQATVAVKAMGTNALPTLQQLLQDRDAWLTQLCLYMPVQLPARQLDSAEDHFDSALQACGILGALASPLIPDILPFLAGHRQPEVVKVLVAIGEESVLPLVGVLQAEDARAWAGAAVALGTLAQKAVAVVPALEAHLKDADAHTRMAAAWALGRYGSRASGSRSRLATLTLDPARNVREQAKVARARIQQGALAVAGHAGSGSGRD